MAAPAIRLASVAWDVEIEAADIDCPDGSERVEVAPSCDGEPLGPLLLPSADGVLAADVLSDAVAARHAWELLRHFLERHVYPALTIEREPLGAAVVARDGVVLGRVPPGSEDTLAERLHDAVGWTVFLQELWGRPDLAAADFYLDAEPPAHGDARRWIQVEVARELERLVPAESTWMEVAIGGAAVTAMPAPARPEAIRAAINGALGFEACRVAVREGILGVPLDDARTLRERLADRAAGRDGRAAGADPVVLGQRSAGQLDSSVSRLMRLPSGAAASLVAAARAAGEPVIERNGGHLGVVYSPGVTWARPSPAPAATNGRPPADGPLSAAHFDAVFAQRDPWSYSSPYERRKYEQTLALLPDGHIGHLLELACAEGHSTADLAHRADRVVATDISPLALERARERCSELDNVEFRLHDLFAEELPGRFDVVVCSEVLYFARSLEALHDTCRRIAEGLRHGGRLVTAHANLVADDPLSPGFDWGLPFGARVIGEALAAAGLQLEHELVTPYYRVQHLRRPRRIASHITAKRPIRQRGDAAGEIPDDVLRRFLPHGGAPVAAEPDHGRETHRLPILMYHRIAPEGEPSTRRYRTTPDEFEQQLAHLRDRGFRSATFEEWAEARTARRPLEGRAVLLTFDDGYQDFADHAAPLLERYGFEANVFLVTDRVGGINAWDEDAGERVRLMDWGPIRELEAAGVRFGAHTATHPRFTELSLTAVAEEVSQARAALFQHLRQPLCVLAYPWGLGDEGIGRLVGGCGYWAAVTSGGGTAGREDDMLWLPRVEMVGGEGLGPLRAHGL